MGQISIGSTAPDFALQTAAGDRAMRLNDALHSGPVVLAFYKASCPTCQFTFPFLQRIYAEGKSGRLTLWGISQDEPDETRSFAARYGIAFPLLIDDHPYAVSSAYGVEFVPAIFIVAADGTVAVSDFGFTKASLNAIAGYEFLKPDDGLPASRPG
jgi:peroxiredoxin